MEDQKIDNTLNLAIDATERELQKSLELDVGFDWEERTWDLIVKYAGDIEKIRSESVDVVSLSNEYAIISVPENLIERVAALPEVEYIEKPKRLYFTIDQGRTSSCLAGVQNAFYDLYGDGVLVAVIDSGIDYAHPDFRNEDGSSRILYLWDQTIQGEPPEGYRIGTEYRKEQIDEALMQSTVQRRMEIVPSVDTSGHGTAVAGIAAGNGRQEGGYYTGVAPRSGIIVIKLGVPRQDSFPRTTELMQAIDYAIRKGIELSMPVAVNISFGNTYGPHDGTSLIEQYIDDIANFGRTSIIIGTGNEGVAAGHTEGQLSSGEEQNIELAVSNNEVALNLQIWKSYIDDFDIAFIHPNGTVAGPFQKRMHTQRFMLGNTELLVYYGEPSPFSTEQEIYIAFIPEKSYIDSGVWKIRLIAGRVVDGRYNMWLPSSSAVNNGTRFTFPSEQTTLTVPSTSDRAISVGAYNSRRNSYADFSGRGYTRRLNLVKPDLSAPGVDIMTTVSGGGYAPRSGTSMATPFVTGAAALLMQWGIVQGNDPYLYGEKLKAYLLKGAKQIPSERLYPNNKLGYGVLCIRDSIP